MKLQRIRYPPLTLILTRAKGAFLIYRPTCGRFRCRARCFVCCIVHRVCIDGGVNREIGANIGNYKSRLHKRILGAYIPIEVKIIHYILLNRIAPIYITIKRCCANRTPTHFQYRACMISTTPRAHLPQSVISNHNPPFTQLRNFNSSVPIHPPSAPSPPFSP